MNKQRFELAGFAWELADADEADSSAEHRAKVSDAAESSELSIVETWVKSGSLPPEELEKASEMLAHINEAETGFASRDPGRPLSGEPRQGYDPVKFTVTSRAATKAKEIGMSPRHFDRIRSEYLRKGISALIDLRRLQKKSGVELHPVVEAAILKVAADLDEESSITNEQFQIRVRRIVQKHPKHAQIPVPSRASMNRAIEEKLYNRGTQRLPAKSLRSRLSRPTGEFGSLVAERPGEYVVIDSTPLDLMAIDPLTLDWATVEMTAAMDVYSRSIVAFVLMPAGTKGSDLALLLADVLSPGVNNPHWPDASEYPIPYIGVPDNIVLRAFDQLEGSALQAKPFVRPGTVIVDRGMNYQSIVFQNACRHLGINVQSARPGRGSDKGWIERFFSTMNTRLLQDLPGYKGSNVLVRGVGMERKAEIFIDELSKTIGEWIVGDYHQRPHDGLKIEGVPKMELTPSEAFAEGLARAGFLYRPTDPHIRQSLLPVQMRMARDDGVQIDGLYYDGPILEEFKGTKSDLQSGKYPFRVDPRDLRSIWFQDPRTGEWGELKWRHGRPTDPPFAKSTIEYARDLLIADGMHRPTEEEIRIKHMEVLDSIGSPQKKMDRRIRKEGISSLMTEHRTGEEKATIKDGAVQIDIRDLDWPDVGPELER